MTYSYELYGLRIGSAFPLKSIPESTAAEPQVSLVPGEERRFARIRAQAFAAKPFNRRDWFYSHRFADLSYYVCWTGLFEFHIDGQGREVSYRWLKAAGHESFESYLVTQILSFALLLMGIEVLHCTVVLVDGQAVGFLGAPGMGKSTLAAAFLKRGHSILTDDLLVLTKEDGGYRAHPGPSRLKLYPHSAKRVLGHADGLGPMVRGTNKMILPLPGKDTRTYPLKTIFQLSKARTKLVQSGVVIRKLPIKDQFLSLVGNTFNSIVDHPARIQSQFQFYSELVKEVPVRKLTYPRRFSVLPDVYQRVIETL